MATVGETAPESAHRTPHTGQETDPAAPTRAGARARVADAVPDRLVRFWEIAVGDAPSPWAERPPSPAEAVRYGRHGDYAGEDTVWRRLGTGYAVVIGGPVTAVLSVLIWLVQRPGRFVALLLLIVLLWLFLGSGLPAGIPLTV